MGKDQTTLIEKQEGLFQEQQYIIGRMTFVVEPRFKESAKETLGSVLLKLMKSEIAN